MNLDATASFKVRDQTDSCTASFVYVTVLWVGVEDSVEKPPFPRHYYYKLLKKVGCQTGDKMKQTLSSFGGGISQCGGGDGSNGGMGGTGW